ncbi:hypothetical protein HHK36_003805 [Tetracentron sinense]|uniref:Uncharacterized protein n=1 Tax=Tetracentron sinense TaxID=13715 RepID=A0A835DPD8_TETSI|nr:hypothetical protein HHK36_003805 [Tetracentron sinense]
MGSSSGTKVGSLLHPFVFFISFFSLEFCTAIDSITSTQSIRDPETVVSVAEKFRLGFFSPGNSTNIRYLGIWYNGIPGPTPTIIWVANRETPFSDSSGVLTIADDGNLVVLDGRRNILWSTNVSNISRNSSAMILESGNLVLREENSTGFLWQSFDHPTDSFLPTMKIGVNLITGEKQILTSWKSDSDPSTGTFSAGFGSPLNIPQIFIWNGAIPHWRSGPWNNRIFIGIPDMYSVYLNGFNVIKDNPEGSLYLTYNYADETFSKIVLSSQGILVQTNWDVETKEWALSWLNPRTVCDVYGKCGPFGSCDVLNSEICSCLRGFEPKSIEEWSKGNWRGGCVRKSQLLCERNNGSREEGKQDGFLKLEMMKVPDSAIWLSGEDEFYCGQQCLRNCSCIAFAYESGIGCMSWSGDLIDIQKFSVGGVDLHIRVAYSELDKKRDVKVIIIITVLIGTIVLGICTYFSCRWWMAEQRGRKKKGMKKLKFDRREESKETSDDSMADDNTKQREGLEIPFFNFENMVIATNNFHVANKLGQGGFGPVYKFCTAIDTITPTQYIRDPESVISADENFKLGFYSHSNSTNRYVGIWYNKIPGPTVIWVANRENPLTDSSGVMKIADNGNLVVFDGQQNILWSTNLTNPSKNSSAMLLDFGNLVLQEGNSGDGVDNQRVLWQSFEHPSDTFLPKMKIGMNPKTDEKILLTSSKSDSNPSTGRFSAGISPLGIPQLFIWNGSHPYWRSGPWNNQVFIGIPRMSSFYNNGFNFLRDNQEGSVYFTFSFVNESLLSKYVLSSQGILVEKYWDDGTKEWVVSWLSQQTDCDFYGKCGPLGSCDALSSQICSCLRGFEPKSTEEWSKGNWRGGCVRKTQLQCEKNNGSHGVGKQDGFLKLEMMKVPDSAHWLSAVDVVECEEQCLRNCSCVAFAYDIGIGCMSWSGNLIDIKKFSVGGVDLHIRVAYSELELRNRQSFASVKLPDLLQFWMNKNMSVKECEVECLTNCSCTAYDSSCISGGSHGCLLWFGSLIDVRRLIEVDDDDQDLYIRLAASELGFTPKSQQEWDLFNWSSGCSRRTQLDCRKGDGFVMFTRVKLPNLLQFWMNKNMIFKEIEVECLKNCSCIAYSSSGISGGGHDCLLWFGNLIDVRRLI